MAEVKRRDSLGEDNLLPIVDTKGKKIIQKLTEIDQKISKKIGKLVFNLEPDTRNVRDAYRELKIRFSELQENSRLGKLGIKIFNRSLYKEYRTAIKDAETYLIRDKLSQFQKTAIFNAFGRATLSTSFLSAKEQKEADKILNWFQTLIVKVEKRFISIPSEEEKTAPKRIEFWAKNSSAILALLGSNVSKIDKNLLEEIEEVFLLGGGPQKLEWLISANKQKDSKAQLAIALFFKDKRKDLTEKYLKMISSKSKDYGEACNQRAELISAYRVPDDERKQLNLHKKQLNLYKKAYKHHHPAATKWLADYHDPQNAINANSSKKVNSSGSQEKLKIQSEKYTRAYIQSLLHQVKTGLEKEKSAALATLEQEAKATISRFAPIRLTLQKAEANYQLGLYLRDQNNLIEGNTYIRAAVNLNHQAAINYLNILEKIK